VLDTRNETWVSAVSGDDPLSSELDSKVVHLERAQMPGDRDRVAVFISLTSNPDRTAFDRLLRDSTESFTSAAMVSVTGADRIDPREAGRLSANVAQQIKQLAANRGRAEVHLAFHGPYTMAVLVGRYLNTLRTVIYEWDGDTVEGPSYTPVLILEPGVTNGPITEVLA
jgi:SMODS-associated and fused to various effectors sensor domain